MPAKFMVDLMVVVGNEVGFAFTAQPSSMTCVP
jgi:hypothetical protein